MSPRGWSQASPEARERYKQSAIKFPVYHFEAPNLLWKDDCWRLASADERDQLFGLPCGYSRGGGVRVGLSEVERMRLLGNAWHVPSFKMLFVALAWCCALPACGGCVLATPLQELQLAVSPQEPVAYLYGAGQAEILLMHTCSVFLNL